MDSARGQTTLDFAIGAGIFLAVILFTFSFVPGILSPFDLTGDDGPAISNQVADSLSQDLLGSPSEPHVLDRYCAVEFFNESRTSPPGDCQYDSLTLTDQFDLSTTSVNITLLGPPDDDGDQHPLCWSREDNDINLTEDDWGLLKRGSGDCDNDDITLTKGDNPQATSQSTTTARRVVVLHDRPVTMEVTVW